TSTLATALMFDPASGTGSWSSAGTMSSARTGHTATLLPSGVLAGQVLLAGGFNGSTELSSAELFSGTSTWTATTNTMPASVQGHTASVLSSGCVLIAGGFSATTSNTAAYLFDINRGLVDVTVNGQGGQNLDGLTVTALDSGGTPVDFQSVSGGH